MSSSSENEKFIYCYGVDGRMQQLGGSHSPENWILLIDSYNFSLKVVLLNNGNTQPWVIFAYSEHMKETYENMDMLLRSINYSKHGWQICGDHNVTEILLGMQPGYTKFCSFLFVNGTFEQGIKIA